MRLSIRISVTKTCQAAMRLAVVASLWLPTTPAQAQNTSQTMGAAASDPLAQEMLRALQQRGGQSSTTTGIQPDVQIQTPPVYPQNYPAVPFNPLQGLLPATSNTGLSSLEKLMSLRVGLRMLQFGYDIFGHGGPVVVRQSGALQDNYILGEGDEIVVTLHGQQNANYRTRVDRDGRVVLPGLAPVSAAGRSFGAFRADLEAAVTHAFVGTQVLASVGEVRQISVRVVGEVGTPGVYSLTGLSSALDALSLAGGVKKAGSLRDIQIVRGGRTIRLDLYGLLTNRAGASDITLTEGDRIIVPLLTRSVAVVGQVKRPAIYEIAPGALGARVDELLALAGGPEVRGAYRFSVMKTGDDGRRETVEVPRGSDAQLHDGDALFVNSSVDASVARVELMGGTTAHGSFGLTSTPTLHALFKSADMFAPQSGRPLPYLLIAAILRLDPQTLQHIVIPFSPIDAIQGKNDRSLQSNDVVYVMNVAEMRYIARRASSAAAREAEQGNDAINPAGRQNQSRYGRDPGGQMLAAGALQNGTGGANALLAGGQPSAAAPNAATLPPGSPNSNDPNAPQNLLPSQLNARGYPKTPAETDQGPYGIVDNDALPRLNGIPAPRRQARDSDDPFYGADDEDDNDSDQARDEQSGGNTNMSRDRIGSADRRTDAYGRPLDRSGEPRQPAQRLFVGLDDDERRLLINTLSNYYVLVSGEVNSPGAFLVMPQVSLDMVVKTAGGVTPNVDLSGFEVSSANVDNASGVSQTERHTYKLSPDQFAQVTLKPLDRVRFNKVFSDRAGEVKLYGEVRYPGAYEVTRTEHLSSVLARAGGLTLAAYPYGAIFLRRAVAEQQRGVMQREADALESQLIGLMGSVTAAKEQISDAEIQYINQMMFRLRQAEGQGGRVAVQIDPKEIAEHPELDVTLEPGDQLFIPRKANSVVVAGEVMSPSGLQFKENLTVADYVAKAGGVTQIADDDHIFVVQPDGSAVQAEGSAWLGGSPKLAPGSVIVVPRTLRPFTWDVLLQNVLQVTSQLAITAASLSVIGR